MKKLIVLVLLIILAVEISVICFKEKEYDSVISFCSNKPCDEIIINRTLLRINWEEFEEIPLQFQETTYLANKIINFTNWGQFRNGGSYAHLNWDSFRGRNVSIEKPEGVKRVIVLGDSFTLGVKLNDSEIFDYIIEKDENQIEILNFGRASYSAESEVDLFFKKGIKYDPDLVIMFPFNNDWENFNTSLNFGWLSYEKLGLNTEDSEKLLADFLFPKYHLYLQSKDKKDLFEERIFLYYDKLIESGYEVIFVMFPFGEERNLLVDYFERNNIEYYELADIGYEYKSPWILDELDWHPSAYAEKRIAEFLKPIILEKLEQ